MATLRLNNGDGMQIERFDELAADNTGTLTSADLPHGHIFIEIDGQAYGSIMLTVGEDGVPNVTLGQYFAPFDQWEPDNPITAPEEAGA